MLKYSPARHTHPSRADIALAPAPATAPAGPCCWTQLTNGRNKAKSSSAISWEKSGTESVY